MRTEKVNRPHTFFEKWDIFNNFVTFFRQLPSPSSEEPLKRVVEIGLMSLLRYVKKSSWNRFIIILLDRNKITKEHDIDTNDGLKTDFYTVGENVHKEEARMSKVHDKIGDSTHKQSKEFEYDFDDR